ncbi:uncharacterized protein LOC117640398 [Thrips palmi]|uniref:Uncharacterized protein LOC117640398 n=1 Tax=Thrips palmi TaxID=161013 RepID=A0A6P8YFR9_THRPL|nr:uncharacterized protein LOC117640398 [Thrips palmi]
MQRLDVEHHLITSWQPAANGLVERDRQLKAAIMCHEDESWVESLPLVLLGIRTAFKDDMACTGAELTYGETLRLPGELVIPIKDDVTVLLGRLRHHELADFTHVLQHTNATRRALEPPYAGPYRVLRRDAKTVEMDIKGRHPTVRVDVGVPLCLTPPLLQSWRRHWVQARLMVDALQDTPAEAVELVLSSARLGLQTAVIRVPGHCCYNHHKTVFMAVPGKPEAPGSGLRAPFAPSSTSNYNLDASAALLVSVPPPRTSL